MTVSETIFARFIERHWAYYLEMEGQLLETSRYAQLCNRNKSTFSVEYLKLFQAICSEIDVVAKSIGEVIQNEIKLKKAYIAKWGYVLQAHFPTISEMRNCAL